MNTHLYIECFERTPKDKTIFVTPCISSKVAKIIGVGVFGDTNRDAAFFQLPVVGREGFYPSYYLIVRFNQNDFCDSCDAATLC